ncbi:MAG TPA: tetraacyldisaccharide 4'-kinase [Pyrinomonadaceae bacterium]|nr:tetraacyldisaccharide 4'-kinase [Pyrinomonadaceae bacterium]
MKSLILPPLSVLYSTVTRARLSLYRRGTLKSFKLDRPVISVGNITTGGTGKTPLVEWVARTVAASGKRVCILTRGYRRDNPDRRVVVSDGNAVLATPSEAGDEPFLLATNLLGIAAVIADADRVAAGREAIARFNTDCFILDDGFQHLRLARDLNIVTIDATNPWGGGHLLPYGRLREPLSSLSRAGCVVITRTDQAAGVSALHEKILRLTNHAPIFHLRVRVTGIKPFKNAPEILPSPVAAFCAVGNPQSFFNQLEHNVVLQKSFPDHHRYTQHDVDGLIEAARRAGAQSLITTAKDAVKLQSISFSLPCYVMEIEPEIDNEAALVQLILNSAME